MSSYLIGVFGSGVPDLNTPNNLGCTAWWDGSDPAGTGTPPSDDSTPSSWVDKSTGASHGLNTLSSLPKFKTNILNGRGIMRFDGVDDGYSSSSAFIFALGTAEVWSVQKSDESGLGQVWGEGISTNGSAAYGVYDDETVDDYVFQFTNTSNVDRFLNRQDRNSATWDLCIATDKGAATGTVVEVVGVDNGTSGSYTRDATSFNRVAAGYLVRNSAGRFFDGDIAEIIVFPSALSAGNRVTMKNYLNYKWGQTWSPM